MCSTVKTLACVLTHGQTQVICVSIMLNLTQLSVSTAGCSVLIPGDYRLPYKVCMIQFCHLVNTQNSTISMWIYYCSRDGATGESYTIIDPNSLWCHILVDTNLLIYRMQSTMIQWYITRMKLVRLTLHIYLFLYTVWFVGTLFIF